MHCRTPNVKVTAAIACVLSVLGCCSTGTGVSTAGTVKPAPPRPVKETGIVYSRIGDLELQLDICYPSEGDGLFPAVVYFCGNAWGYYSWINRKQYDYAIWETAQRGYVALTADYRSTSLKENGKSIYCFPDQVHDAKCVIRWVRANAEKYRVDPDRIGVIGWSSGGHLALMVGLTDPQDGLEGDCGDPGLSSRVRAVVSLAGPTELTCLSDEPWNLADTIDFIGGTLDELPELYRRASPLIYADRGDPPVLTVQGSADTSVPPNQAVLLDERMKAVGAAHTLVIKEGAGHANFYDDPAVWEFLDKHLKLHE